MNGLIIIPDITGFTNFVKNTNIDLGVSVISDLLNEVIDSNPLDIEISEIEGDAILFYKLGKPLCVKQVFAGLKTMYDAFNSKFETLKNTYNLQESLSLKFIVHYGEIHLCNIRGFKNLFGQTVIEAHCLLKNGEGNSDYILITDDYLEALEQNVSVVHSVAWRYSTSVSQSFCGLRQIKYSFYNLAMPNNGKNNCHYTSQRQLAL
ncbi:DUF2652 domain-containing protein [Segetibacter aerophilus]|uniref:Guanylate cyclase domain-containing protein n=1 Tax=Segetibacter aerophilus TaxID=670293 RepID=A0A512BHG6_9BACT|nr:DUF2652 domain-containing protein [Segetibacter aerophilus]GEO11404.1 hypothetical protein SAE01_39000 [Segetibacter aerophilus]